jgi:hypothetical protein
MGNSAQSNKIAFHVLFLLGIACFIASIATFWTNMTFQAGFSKLSQFHYDISLGLTKFQTCVLTPFHRQESCSSKSYWSMRDSGNEKSSSDDNDDESGFENPLGKLQERCQDQLIATDLFVFISIASAVVGLGLYFSQDSFEKLTGVGALPLKIGSIISSLFSAISVVLWSAGGCYLGFKNALEDAHAKISSFPFGNTMAVGKADVQLGA